jgi:hypothetical protein
MNENETTNVETVESDEYAEFLAYKAAKAEAKAKAEAEAKARIEAAEKAKIEAEAKKPKKGYLCRVVRGKKVPIGTEGVCFYLAEGKYGLRIGLRVEGQTEPVWTAAGNCEAIRKDEATSDSIASLRSAEAALLESLGGEDGIVGKILRVKSGRNAGFQGRVFWAKGTRIGLKVRPAAEPVWEFVGRCEAVA